MLLVAVDYPSGVKTPDAVHTVGTIADIWRYPVKSMAGERLDAVDIGPAGLHADRGWAVRSVDTGESGSAKKWPRLLLCAARSLPDVHSQRLPHVEITLPDGTSLRSDQRDHANAHLSAFLSRPVALVPADLDVKQRHEPRTAYFDVGPYHLLTTASLRALSALLPDADIDVRRFRPNILIDSTTEPPKFIEQQWTGCNLCLGEHPMTAGGPVPRCGMVAAQQPALTKAPSILATIIADLDRHLGIYGETDRAGRIRVGDTVTLAR